MSMFWKTVFLSIGLLSTIAVTAQTVQIYATDGNVYSGTIKGPLEKTRIKVKDFNNSRRDAILPYHVIDKIVYPDQCTMSFHGAPLTFEGISNPVLTHKGATPYIEDLFRVNKEQLRTLLPDEDFKSYQNNRVLLTSGAILSGVGLLATAGMTVLTIYASRSITYTDFNIDSDHITLIPIKYTPIEDLPASHWIKYAGSVVALVGGLTCFFIANRNIKEIEGRFNASVTPAGIVFRF